MAGNLKYAHHGDLQNFSFYTLFVMRLHLFKNTLNTFFPNANHSVFCTIQYCRWLLNES
jgi:hypothetical protein